MKTPHRTPDWLLERIALGELPPDELAAARARLAQEPDGAARLAALEEDNRLTLEQRPPALVAREVEARAARSERLDPLREKAHPWRPLMPALAFVPVLAVVFLMVRPGPRPPDAEPIAEVTRTKGLTPQLGLHRLGAAGPEPLADGARAAVHDVVQVSYVAAGNRYGAILSLDGRGAVTLHAPEDGLNAWALAPSGTHALSRAYELDDAPAFERFIFVASDSPFPLEGILVSARELAASNEARTAPLPLPAGFRQVSFTLEKNSP
ncbi:ActD-like protein [Stigmatella sp. ncwal1]|uniref:ActD-like protein n=1 Tax=Stigmatella ashevillensis TaxID=2995309 RepID=A0ABT5DFG9_9BACT|nr:ActD-like protein [Stigmatella ashevillena]MDC0712406.1 ActD-like protein [Stigmatella ashevillena]